MDIGQSAALVRATAEPARLAMGSDLGRVPVGREESIANETNPLHVRELLDRAARTSTQPPIAAPVEEPDIELVRESADSPDGAPEEPFGEDHSSPTMMVSPDDAAALAAASIEATPDPIAPAKISGRMPVAEARASGQMGSVTASGRLAAVIVDEEPPAPKRTSALRPMLADPDAELDAPMPPAPEPAPAAAMPASPRTTARDAFIVFAIAIALFGAIWFVSQRL